MNGIQRRKVGNNEKPFPGCLGRMVNLFDLSTGVSRNKLLTDAPHREGSSLSRNQADVARMFNHSTNQSEDNLSHAVPEFQRASNKRAHGTPVKMLIDQEMSEMDCMQNPPNVVAKLMGLETLPHQLPGSSVQRNNVRSYPKSRIENHGVPLGGCRERSDFLEEGMQCQVNECSEQKEYKDVYEIWQRSPRTNYIREKLPKGIESEVVNDRKMALVRQKFVEAKRLATDEKLRQSKEFQDALEVLSSNKDLFVKFLQEPNSLFTQHLNELPSIPPSPETKRITVLRPSKVSRDERFTEFEKKSYRQPRLPAQRGQSATLDKSDSRLSPTPAINRTNEYAVAVQPTRIVVLKPSPGRNHDNKPIASSPGSLPRVVQDESFNEGFEDDDVKESRKFARNITQKMCDNLLGHRRDETLLSSVFSNGYTGDESSFEKSENDYAVENLSDLEVMSSSSHHSWEFVNRYSSPYSSSSFSRISCSPESSVCREAKKRLSERWAMMTTHGNYQERRHVRRNSSTLGEMLALSDAKKSTVTDNEINEHEPSELDPCFNSDENIECLDDSPSTLIKSKSVPGSSALFGVLNLEASDLETVKTDDPKLLARAKGVKSSFNEKVSSLFFSRNKKTNKEKYSGSPTKDEPQSCSAETLSSSAFIHHSRSLSNAASHSNDGEGCSSGTSFLHLTNVVARGGAVHHEAGLSVKRPFVSGNVGENQEQPSPISVLEPPFFEDDNTHLEFSSYLKPRNQEFCMPFKNSLIDKSPPIESIARSIFWDGSCSVSSAPCALKSSPVSTCLEEEQNWHCLVEALLTMSGLGSEVQQCGLMFTRWHSLGNPLDPSLRNKYANLSSKEPMLEAKRRQLRSSRKLVFDCVNAALIDITSQELDHRQAKISSRAHDSNFAEDTSLTLLDCVMVKLKDWVCGESRCVTGDIGDSNSLVVEKVVREEVGGKSWDEHLMMEMDSR